MDEALKSLLTLAFDEAPAVDATARIAAARERFGAGAPMRSYEVELAPDADFERFTERVVPKMVYHFESLGIRPPEGTGAFVSFFVGDRLHFVHLRDVFGTVCARTSLSPDELLRRFGTGERRTALRDEEAPASGAPVALLGPGPTE